MPWPSCWRTAAAWRPHSCSIAGLVFRGSSNRLHQQIAWFVTVNALALLQTLVVSLLLADILLPWFGVTWHVAEIAHAAGIVVPIFTSYMGHKKWTFR